ncbi:DUF2255 family protein [Streptomyces fractus]|uniref:DUF2255 family protein n=1 Tax=Streptomyces fractus TaxID=641806 RepID=UPI003CF54ABD
MSTWDPARLRSFAAVDDLHISPFREDGVTCGTPTWIWSVVAVGDLYVRPYNGPESRWYRAAMTQRGGRIHIAGTEYPVRFDPADPAAGSVLDAVDAAYRPSTRPARTWSRCSDAAPARRPSASRLPRRRPRQG